MTIVHTVPLRRRVLSKFSDSYNLEIRFVEESVIPSIEDIYRDLRPLYQFYLAPKNFKNATLTVEAGVFMRAYL